MYPMMKKHTNILCSMGRQIESELNSAKTNPYLNYFRLLMYHVMSFCQVMSPIKLQAFTSFLIMSLYYVTGRLEMMMVLIGLEQVGLIS